MTVGRTLFVITALFSIIFAIAAPSAASPPDPLAASHEAMALVDRLQSSARPDLASIPGLANAGVGEGLLVSSYPGLEPLYYLCPIQAFEGGVIGLVSIDAGTGAWSWYTFGYRGESYPRVGAAQAAEAARALAGRLGARTEVEAPRAVALPDKQLYWLVGEKGAPNPYQTMVPFDDPQAAPLSSLDGSLAPHLNPMPGGERPPAPSAEELARAGRAEPRTRPAVCIIPNAPFHFQITSWYCGCASSQMLMDLAGEEIGQNDIGDVENENSSYGTYNTDNRRACHFSGMSTAIQNAALRGYRERPLGYAANDAYLHADPYNHLKNMIAAGYAIEILTCYDSGCTSGHYRLAKGYDDGLDEFIVHDPWYNSPYWGPDLHFNQEFLVQSLWDPWSSCWGLMSVPWELKIQQPGAVAPGDTFRVSVDVNYPGPVPFSGLFQATNAGATIELPAGFALAAGSARVTLPTLLSGQGAHVDWDVIAPASEGTAEISVQAQGTVTGSSHFYASYTDSIGGHARTEVTVGTSSARVWTADERLTSDPAPSTLTYPAARAMVVEAGGVIHMVWADARDGNSEIYYRRWDGAWGPEVRLTSDPGYSDHPAIARSPDGALHVVWVDTRAGNPDIYYKKFSGGSWSSDLALTTNSRPDQYPAIAADGLGNVHVVWQTTRSNYYNKIYYRKWDGSTWSTETAVASVAARDIYTPSIAADALGRVHLVYEQDTANRGPSDIFYRLFNGSSWQTPDTLTANAAYAHAPTIALGPDSVVHVVWQDGQNLAGDIYYRRKVGSAWGAESPVVNYAGDSEYPSLAADAHGNVYLAWEEYRDGGPEIYYKDWQGSWTEDQRLTFSGHACLPVIGVDGSANRFVAWTDGRDGNTEIYAKRSSAVASDVEGGLLASGEAARGSAFTAVWPIPGSAAVHLRFELAAAGRARLEIFDARGRRVNVLVETSLAAGPHETVWRGADDTGKRVASGVYFARLETEGRAETRRIVLVR